MLATQRNLAMHDGAGMFYTYRSVATIEATEAADSVEIFRSG